MKPQSWDDLLAERTPEVAEAARAVRREVAAALPDAHVEYDPGNLLLAVGLSPRMRDLLFAIIPHSKHVNLQLADGADLPDPAGIVEGTGKRIRHVTVRSAEGAAAPAVRDLIRAQIERRGEV